MRYPKISVIVPIYNSEIYLYRCIDSILSQNYNDFELLLIDDGSTDKSGIICDEYAKKDSRIRVFHKDNGGVSSARNVGLDNANGEWITFADSDDCLFPEWLGNFNKSVDIDLSCQGMVTDKPLEKYLSHTVYSFDFHGNPIEFLQVVHHHQILGYLFLKLFKNDYIKEYHIRFDESVSLQEDDIFVLQYLKYCSIIQATSRCGYNYFVPDWGNKHNITLKEHIEKHKKILNEIRAIPHAKETSLYYFHQALLAQCLINDFCDTKNYDDLRLLRIIHCDNPNASEMNKFSKFILLHDKNMIISSFIIRFINRIGKVFNKLRRPIQHAGA